MIERMNFSGVWRDYQARVLEELEGHFEDERLHVVAAPGAGKTILGLEIIRHIGRPALIFAPTTAIRDQWLERLTPLFLSEPPVSSEVSQDLSNPKVLTTATYQALDAFRRGDSLEGLIETLNQAGPFTLVLDEAHHLRREWWRSLKELTDRLKDIRVVALTATPPYDASFAEWSRYEQLCGPIDLEIGIPELVRNGDLCPHQDHVIFSKPTEDALALLDRRRAATLEIMQDLIYDEELLHYLSEHPWLTSPEDHIEEILGAPELLSAALILLNAAGWKLPKTPLEILGVSRRHIPQFTSLWLERFLSGAIGKRANVFRIGQEAEQSLRNRLHRHGLIEGGEVRLHKTRSVFRMMASSIAKLNSIADIAKAEHTSLGKQLRMVILSDHIRAGELPNSPEEEFQPAKLGVIPIFETLRRASGVTRRLGVLTGSLVIVPRSVDAKLDKIATEIGIDPRKLRRADIPACPEHVRINLSSTSNARLVRLITELFARGEVEVLVGTQSLLGEGWDAPTLNSLVLASNTASFMLSNQMRGRAIRIDPATPDKVSNIWHLATIEPEATSFLQEAAAHFNWGFLNDGGLGGMSDANLIQRRFRAFEGVSNGHSNLIASGTGRLGISLTHGIEAANRQSFAIASNRNAVAQRWAVSLGEGNERSRVRETTASNYAPRQLAWLDTINALVWSGVSTGAIAAANEMRQLASWQGIGIIGMVLAGGAFVAGLPKLSKAARLVWRNGSLEGSLHAVGDAILIALHRQGLASSEELAWAHFEVRESLDGRKDVVLTGVESSVERQVMTAMAELLGPVQNPRYILVRKSRLGWRTRADYHAVPTVFGAKKDSAQAFATIWNNKVGSSKLVYARTLGGRRELLKARTKSLAAGFQRSADRRSAWL